MGLRGCRANQQTPGARSTSRQVAVSEIDEYYGTFRISNDLIELRNLAVVGSLIIESALARHESRGLHYTLDFPEMDSSSAPADTVLTPPRP